MFRIHMLYRADAAALVPPCTPQPARFHAQVRTARHPGDSPFRLEVRDSAMPTRFHVV